VRAFAVALGVLIAAAACNDKPAKPDGGDGGMTDGPRPDTPVDRPDADARPDTTVCPNPTTKKLTGDACTCGNECTSGFCADGVCCMTACTEGCKSCAVAGSAGTCVNLAVGANPRVASDCAVSQPVELRPRRQVRRPGGVPTLRGGNGLPRRQLRERFRRRRIRLHG
jgi:hypothetical protein